jgi:hypothetical protein
MVLVGPSCTYTEFMEYINGSNMKVSCIYCSLLAGKIVNTYFLIPSGIQRIRHDSMGELRSTV